jgi:hypothetical protein
MTEKSTPKKPRRKRRTKAQIEAEKAAKLAAETSKEVAPAEEESWQKTDEVVAKMFEEAVTSEKVVEEAPAKPAPVQDSNYSPLTGMSKLRQKLHQRRLRDQLRR